MSYYFTSESVSQGHPDKVADQISDAIVDNFIARDPNSHCAIETLVTTGQVVVAGEVRSEAYVDIQDVVRKTINKIGYTKSDYCFDGNSCGVLNAIHEQSENINRGVSRAEFIQQGAGDQGIMFGYATNETSNYMPATLDIAHKIVKELAVIREEHPELMPYLRPDAKSQVTIRYSDDNIPERITDIVVSTQHDEFGSDDEMLAKIREDIINIVIPRVVEKCASKVKSLFQPGINYYVNPTGKFVIGGPHGDTGLCLAGDTKIYSPDYPDNMVAISDIKVGDTVYTETGVAKVVDHFSNGVKPVKKITDKFGYSIEATANHPFRVRIPGTNAFEWKECDSLEIGDELVCRYNMMYEIEYNDIIYTWAEIVSIEDAGEKETWDITLDDDTHSFVANGFIVHNTGRKIIVDTYGGWGAHGGGAFCGKDVSKVDRSAAYMARYMAKNAVAAGIADRMLIQLAYAIGVAEPISIFVDTYGTSKVNYTDGEIAEKLKTLFDLRPYAIEQILKLREPIYEETASYGHMGQEPRVVSKVFTSNYENDIVKEVELFTWEKLDRFAIIRNAFKTV